MNTRNLSALPALLARGVALFGGTFAALNLVGDLYRSGFDATLWWIDLRALPAPLAAAVAWTAAAALLAYALRPAMSPTRRALTVATLAVVCGIALANALTVWSLDARGHIDAAFAAPFSLAVAAASLAIITAILLTPASPLQAGPEAAAAEGPGPQTRRSRSPWPARLTILLVAATCSVAFPLGQMLCFGKTDYRRHADAAVVFGCRAYADGRPSQALADRVATAAQLYRDGLVSTLIMSGGPGDGPIHETQSMRRLALRLGVPDHAILLDPAGLDTQSTVTHTAALAQTHRFRRLIAVSHFYHLPRIKLTFQRAGLDPYTVPATESRTLTQLPYNLTREVAALWLYYLRPLAI